MKYKRITGLFWLLLAFGTAGYSQNTIDLVVKLPASANESGAAMFKKLHLTNPVHLKFSDLNPKIEQIIGFFENSGYPFVQVRLDSVQPVSAGVTANLSINPEERVVVDTVLNRTGFRISAPVLYRLMNIRPGDLYKESAVNEAYRRLGQISYLRQIRPLEVGFHPGNASVYVYPEKASANRFDGWVGLSPDLRTAGKLAFSGALTLNLNNTLGQGENWQFDWHRNQDGSQKLNLATNIPYLAGLPFGLKGMFELFRQDTSYLNIGWDIGIPYYFNQNSQLNLFFRHQESSILTSETNITGSTRQPFTTFLSGLSWEFSRLDNRINPYRGVEWRLEASTGRKSIPDSISMQQSEFMAKISWFQPLAKSLTCAFIVQSGYRKSPVSYENEQYRLGGLGLLRGFDEDVFHTDAFAVTSIELRYLLDQTSHLVLLTDLGFLQMTENNNTILKIPIGLGVGGQIRTAGGIFRIIFAIGKEGDQPFNIKNSKIHLGYVGVF